MMMSLVDDEHLESIVPKLDATLDKRAIVLVVVLLEHFHCCSCGFPYGDLPTNLPPFAWQRLETMSLYVPWCREYQ